MGKCPYYKFRDNILVQESIFLRNKELVGAEGFEPSLHGLEPSRLARLSYAPIRHDAFRHHTFKK